MEKFAPSGYFSVIEAHRLWLAMKRQHTLLKLHLVGELLYSSSPYESSIDFFFSLKWLVIGHNCLKLTGNSTHAYITLK